MNVCGMINGIMLEALVVEDLAKTFKQNTG